MTQERIICAAIHFKDGNKHTQQPSNIETGFVIAGRRHFNCYRTLQLIGEHCGQDGIVRKAMDLVGRDCQGFITDTDRFVDRKEGMLIAKAAGQLIYPELHNNEPDAILTSEDLY